MVDSRLYPNPDRLEQLKNALGNFFAQIPYVARVMVFGSLARQDYDAWSDLDFIVVTASEADFWEVFAQLQQFKPILHHGPENPPAEPCGAYIVGIVFEGEAIFHCLDLNFLSLAQSQSPDALARFGEVQVLYRREDVGLRSERKTGIFSVSFEAHPDETRINEAVHFTKKALKKVLRQKGTLSELQARLDWLKSVMSDYAADIVLPGGKIGIVAHEYIEMADALLRE